MTNFDNEIRNEMKQDSIIVPEEIHLRLEETLQSLDEKNEKNYNKLSFINHKRILTIAASIAFALFVCLPNVSVTYAQVMSEIPVIGSIINVFTVRNYLHDGEKQELVATIPNVTIENDVMNPYDLNDSINVFTTKIVDQFYADLTEMESEEYCKSVTIDYEVITNSFDWFTLRIDVTEIEASAYTYAKYYHINRTNGEIVTFADLFDRKNYAIIENFIISEMNAQMKADKNIVYFLDNSDTGVDTGYLTDYQNFYFDENKNLIIVYDEYTVAPGHMGMPEIKIPVSIYESLMKN